MLNATRGFSGGRHSQSGTDAGPPWGRYCSGTVSSPLGSRSDAGSWSIVN
jgi:hypothetical protein